jgi:hypothetical protein
LAAVPRHLEQQPARDSGRLNLGAMADRGTALVPIAARVAVAAMSPVAALVALAALGAACAQDRLSPPRVTPIDSPAPPGSELPNLAPGSEGQAALIWVERRAEEGHVLRLSSRSADGAWSPARAIAGGPDWFVNWADFPSLIIHADGSLVAHWLVRSGAGKYDYDIRLARSTDGGRAWSEPFSAYADGGGGEHGFVSMVAAEDGSTEVIWLDGRNLGAEKDGSIELRHARLGADGRPGPQTVLDERVCDCCQTSAARTGQGLIVVYRDRGTDERRDISWIVERGGRWEEPRPLWRDGWEIHGCPVNGPAVDAEGDGVAVAWFTAAGDRPAVRLAFSADAGSSWGEPIGVDEGRPLGRVDVAMAPGGGAVVIWMESAGDAAEIRVRRVAANGRRGPSERVASSSSDRDSGFPRLVRAGRELLVAWTASDEPARVRAALVTF